jgi:hypothetical protein
MNKSETVDYLIKALTEDVPQPKPGTPEAIAHRRLTDVLDSDGEVQAIADFARRGQSNTRFADLLSFILMPQADRADILFASQLQSKDLESWGGVACNPHCSTFTPQSGARRSDDSRSPILQTDFGIDNDCVEIATEQSKIASGLCWIWIVHTKSEKVTLYMPELELANGKWWFRKSLLEVVGQMPDEIVEFRYLQVADDSNFEAFQTDEVRSFVGNLPDESPQRLAAEAYLGLNHNSESDHV